MADTPVPGPLSRYRKLVVAVIGLALMFVNSTAEPFDDEQIGAAVDGVIALLTAFGVFRVPNRPLSREELSERLRPHARRP